MKRAPKAVTYPQWHYAYYNNSKNVPWIPYNNAVIYNETIIGYENKDWRQQIAKHQDASTDYTLMTAGNIKPFRLVGQATSKYGPYVGKVDLSLVKSTVAPDLQFNTTADDRAVSKLKRKLSEEMPKEFKSLIPLGEIKETHRLLRSTNEAVVNFLKASLSLKSSGIGKTTTSDFLKATSDLWLQLNFAIAPTIRDIEDLADTIVDTAVRSPDKMVSIEGKATERITGPKIAPFAQNAACYTTNLSGYMESSGTIRHQYSAGLLLKLRNNADYSAIRQFGLRWQDAPSALWELTPYSWVVDYFTTFGQYVDDIWWTPPGTTIYCNRSRLQLIKQVTHWQWNIIDGFGSASLNTRTSEIEHVFYKREKLSSLPHRSFRIRTLDEIGRNGFTKIANLSAVLGARSKGRAIR